MADRIAFNAKSYKHEIPALLEITYGSFFCVTLFEQDCYTLGKPSTAYKSFYGLRMVDFFSSTIPVKS